MHEKVFIVDVQLYIHYAIVSSERLITNHLETDLVNENK